MKGQIMTNSGTVMQKTTLERGRENIHRDNRYNFFRIKKKKIFSLRKVIDAYKD